MEKNVIQINGRIMINVDVSVKNVMYVKKMIFNMQLSRWKIFSRYDGNEIIKSYNEETKTVPTNLNKKNMQPVKQKIFMFYVDFY